MPARLGHKVARTGRHRRIIPFEGRRAPPTARAARGHPGLRPGFKARVKVVLNYAWFRHLIGLMGDRMALFRLRSRVCRRHSPRDASKRQHRYSHPNHHPKSNLFPVTKKIQTSYLSEFARMAYSLVKRDDIMVIRFNTIDLCTNHICYAPLIFM
jgi:hypothetical protein